jgi:DnaJ-class molecular chaperone
MVIETKFSIGECVSGIYKHIEPTKVQCTMCDGKGKVFVQGKDATIVCYPCMGDGYIIRRDIVQYRISSLHKIESIIITGYDDPEKGVSVEYVLDNDKGRRYNQDMVFSTFEDAEIELIKLNNML